MVSQFSSKARISKGEHADLFTLGYAFDQAENSEDFTPIGFPPLGPSDIPRCGTGLGVRMCSRKGEMLSCIFAEHD